MLKNIKKSCAVVKLYVYLHKKTNNKNLAK